MLSFATGHVFAYMGLAEAAMLEGDPAQARLHLATAGECLKESSFDWKYYMRELGISLERKTQELEAAFPACADGERGGTACRQGGE